MWLVDTSVVGNLLLDGPLVEPARELYERDADWHTEPLLFIELTNVLATGSRVRGLPVARGQVLLERAHEMLDGSLHPAPDGEVLAVATRLAVSGYDGRFLCLAAMLGVPLVTEDARLRRKAPDLTCSLAQALARG